MPPRPTRPSCADLRLLIGREGVDQSGRWCWWRCWCAACRTPARPSRRRRWRAPARSRGPRSSPTRITSGVLADRRAQGGGERSGVRADLALRDRRQLGLVHELDRILDRDDVLVVRLVDQVDDRRQRGRLAGAGRPSDQHQAAAQVRQASRPRPAVQLVERRDLFRDHAEHRRAAARLDEVVAAEAADAVHAVGEVELDPVASYSCHCASGVSSRIIARSSASASEPTPLRRSPAALPRRRTRGSGAAPGAGRTRSR